MHRTRYLAPRPLMLIAGTALSFANTATAQPILCDDLKAAQSTEPADVAPETLPGTYTCTEEGLSITLRLDANGRFEQRFDVEAGAFSVGERAEYAAAGRVGRWRVERGTLYLFERPDRAPAIEMVGSARDPSVWMRVEVREGDGRPARGLFVGEGAEANPRSRLDDDGVLVVPRDYAWTPGLHQIVREGDELALASFTPTADGPNVFRFVYRPSEVEPFEERAEVVDAARGLIAVPLGIGGALLRRVVPAA